MSSVSCRYRSLAVSTSPSGSPYSASPPAPAAASTSLEPRPRDVPAPRSPHRWRLRACLPTDGQCGRFPFGAGLARRPRVVSNGSPPASSVRSPSLGFGRMKELGVNDQTHGRLTPVQLRDIWSSEANDFTPWLAREENLSILGEVLGLVRHPRTSFVGCRFGGLRRGRSVVPTQGRLQVGPRLLRSGVPRSAGRRDASAPAGPSG